MPKSTKAKANSLVGFSYGGFYKVGYVHLFKHNGPFEEIYEKLKVQFGDGVVGRYAMTSDVDVHFDEVCKQCEEFKSGEHVFKMNVTPMANIIKDVTSAKKLSHFGPDKEDEEEDDSKDTKKDDKKKTKKDKDSSDDEDEKKPAKKAPAKKGSTKKDESDDEEKEEKKDKKPTKKSPAKDESDDEKKEKKPAKKAPAKKESPKKKKDDSDSDDSDEE